MTEIESWKLEFFLKIPNFHSLCYDIGDSYDSFDLKASEKIL